MTYPRRVAAVAAAADDDVCFPLVSLVSFATFTASNPRLQGTRRNPEEQPFEAVANSSSPHPPPAACFRDVPPDLV